tara:strand:- start:356 stop:850 length:495 start_codon:yes stop_codon:yes gene_type:complete
MTLVKVRSRGINLADNFAFTGTISGAGGGKINQVVSATQTADMSTSSTSYVQNFSLNITPSATSSKIMIVSHTGRLDTSSSGATMAVSIYRGSTNITNYTQGGAGGRFESANASLGNMSINLVDSPSSTSQQTYYMYYKSESSSHTVFLNNDSLTSLIAMEILA